MNRGQHRIKAHLHSGKRPSVCRRFLLCLIVVVVSGSSSVAQDPRGQRPFDYSLFQIIAERNIFNASRSGRPQAPTSDEASARPRVDAFTLVGTLRYGKGPFAFFNGTSSDYRKVLRPGETIAGYKVTDITSGQVTLGTETNQLELKIGMELRREAEGAWERKEHAEAYGSVSSNNDPRSNDSRRGDSRNNEPRRGDPRGLDPRRGDSRSDQSRGMASSSISPSGTASGSRPSLSSSEEAEILKKLIEQREKELK
jgi:hypothetical protein